MTACPDRVAQWLQPETAILDVEVKDVDHALRLIADSIADHHGLDAARTYRALARREAAGSTAMGSGFAIPHGRMGGLDFPLTLLLRAKTPIAFRAPDGLPVTLMLAIMVPDDGHKSDHLQLLALVAALFSRVKFRRSLACATSAEEVTRAFRSEIEAPAPELRRSLRRPVFNAAVRIPEQPAFLRSRCRPVVYHRRSGLHPRPREAGPLLAGGSTTSTGSIKPCLDRI